MDTLFLSLPNCLPCHGSLISPYGICDKVKSHRTTISTGRRLSITRSEKSVLSKAQVLRKIVFLTRFGLKIPRKCADTSLVQSSNNPGSQAFHKRELREVRWSSILPLAPFYGGTCFSLSEYISLLINESGFRNHYRRITLSRPFLLTYDPRFLRVDAGPKIAFELVTPAPWSYQSFLKRWMNILIVVTPRRP